MALFSRREVQQAIDQCATLTSSDAIARKLAELNASNENSLPAEWEIMVTAAASRYCPLQYEPALGGSRRADLLMKPDGIGTPGCLVEVMTISDEHARESNPYDRVCEAIHRRIKKLGAPRAGWNIHVEGKQVGEYGDAEMRLLLGTGRPEDLLDEKFHDFVRLVRAQPSERRVHEWRGELLGLTLRYDPNTRGVGGGHLSYTVVHSYERNPLARALKAKTKQLRSTGHPGPYGLVVCDGDCNVLGSRLTSNGTSFSVRDILFHHAKEQSPFVLCPGALCRNASAVIPRSEQVSLCAAWVAVRPRWCVQIGSGNAQPPHQGSGLATRARSLTRQRRPMLRARVRERVVAIPWRFRDRI